MNDALLDEMVAAFADDLRPIRRFFCLHEEGVTWVCPLVALAIRRGVVDRADPEIEIDGGANAALEWAAIQWGEDFVIGLLDGFDGRGLAKTVLEYVDGHALGVKAAQQLLPRDPPV